MNALFVATNILSFMTDCDLNKLYGQGYDGCATIAGKEDCVSKLICDEYSKSIVVAPITD